MDRTLKENPNKICFIDVEHRYDLLHILEGFRLKLIQNKYKEKEKATV
jgi:hypothetical protein